MTVNDASLAAEAEGRYLTGAISVITSVLQMQLKGLYTALFKEGQIPPLSILLLVGFTLIPQ